MLRLLYVSFKPFYVYTFTLTIASKQIKFILLFHWPVTFSAQELKGAVGNQLIFTPIGILNEKSSTAPSLCYPPPRNLT